MISAEDFRLEAELLAEGLPSVEKFQKALMDAYIRGIRQGGKHALAAIDRAFDKTEKTLIENGGEK